MTNGVLGRGMRFLITAIALVGLLFAALLLSASIAVIGFKFSAALSYGLAVLVIWTVLEALERFGSAFFRKYEPWLIMASCFSIWQSCSWLPKWGREGCPMTRCGRRKAWNRDISHFTVRSISIIGSTTISYFRYWALCSLRSLSLDRF